MIQKILDTSHKGKVVFVPREFTRVSNVFVRYGGSWRRLYLGSVEEVVKLKKVIKVAIKSGYLTQRGKW